MQKILFIIAAALSVAAQAHPGHDHSDWTSPVFHALAAAAIVTALAGTAWAVRHHQKMKRITQKEEK